MITYVNTVLVSNLTSSNLLSEAPTELTTNTKSNQAGKFIIMTLDEAPAKITTTSGGNTTTSDDSSFPYITTTNADKYQTIRIGIVTGKNATKIHRDPVTGAISIKYVPIVKWSNKITAGEIKSYAELVPGQNPNSEDTAVVNFSNIDSSILSKLAQGGKRIIVRLTFKDLPTRFRKWTESYEYVTEVMDVSSSAGVTAAKTKIASDIAELINKQYKRARVTATSSTASLTLTAMPYDDDDKQDSLNWANKGRFNVNIYYTDPAAEGWESTNKNFPKGVTITKTPGKQYAASGKLVRDREAQAMGYLGILNRGEGTWPVVKPDMEADIDTNYNAITLEFERTYRAADDIFRKTKECVEIYTAAALGNLSTILKTFVNA